MRESSALSHYIIKTPLNTPLSAQRILALPFIIALGLSSCAKDDGYDETRGVYTETISIGGLTAEVDDSSLKAMGFTMGKDANGKDVPLHRLEDGKVYQVHTALSNGTASGVATLKWRYEADPDGSGPKKDRLIMENWQSITLTSETAFTPGATGWYVAGIMGGTLDFSRIVTITPTRELTGVNRSNPTGSTFDLEVPFAFPWTAVTIASEPWYSGTRTVATQDQLVFKPMGSLIGYELGNALGAGTTYTPTGFTVMTNAFRDEGVFSLKPTGTPTSGAYPSWSTSASTICSDSDPTATMSYTFASSTPAGSIAHGDYSSYRYYAWVMPSSGVTAANTKLLLRGTVTGSAVTNRLGFWTTDYTPTSTGVPQQHKSYRLKASLSGVSSIKLPIETVAEYNLAGGSTGYGNYAYPQNPKLNWETTQVNLPGLDGVLRFTNRSPSTPATATYSTPHNNDASSYDNWYVLTGTYHVNYNPNTLNLQTASVVDTDGSTIAFNTKYYIPSQEDWWGVLSGQPSQFNWTDANGHLTQESFRIGYPDNPLRFTSSCSYSNPVTDGSGNQVVYALRFVQPPSGSPTWSYSWYTPVTGLDDLKICYPVIPDNSLVSAYRYTRVGDHSIDNLADHLKVEVWYLGEAGYNKLKAQLGRTPTAADLQTYWGNPTISSSSVITRLFPATGRYSSSSSSSAFSSPGRQFNQGIESYYWTQAWDNNSTSWYVGWRRYEVSSLYGGPQYYGFAVRPFLR